MRKGQSNAASKVQVEQWLERNRDPGTLPCVPVIMINSLCGEKTGLVINIAHGMSLDNTLKLLRVAVENVEKQANVEHS